MAYVTRRSILKGMASGVITAGMARVLRPAFSLADIPVSGEAKNLVVVFLRGGVDALGAFPFLSGTRHGGQIAARRTRMGVPSQVSATAGLAVGGNAQLAFHRAWQPLYPWFSSQQRVKLIMGYGNPQDQGVNLSHDVNQAIQDLGTSQLSTQAPGLYARMRESFGLGSHQVIGLGSRGGREFSHSNEDLRPLVAYRLANLSYASFNDTIGIGAQGDGSGDRERDALLDAARQLRAAHLAQHPHSDTARMVVESLNHMDEAATFFSQVNTAVVPFQNQFTTSNVGESLKGIAKVISSLRSQQQSRIFYTTYIGNEWDMHSDESAAMATHVGDLASNLNTFAQSIQSISADEWRRTMIITTTEFGRCVFENGDASTDHATGSAALAFGGSVNGGVIMDPALLTRDWSATRDVPVSVHYQNLFSQALQWMGFDPQLLFPRSTYSQVDLQLT